jgi:hypothetical protein
MNLESIAQRANRVLKSESIDHKRFARDVLALIATIRGAKPAVYDPSKVQQTTIERAAMQGLFGPAPEKKS